MNANTNQFTVPQASALNKYGYIGALTLGVVAALLLLFGGAELTSAPTNAEAPAGLFFAAQAAPTPQPATDWYAEGPLRVEDGADGNRWVIIDAGSFLRCDSLATGRPIYNSIKGGEFVAATLASWTEVQRTEIVSACMG